LRRCESEGALNGCCCAAYKQHRFPRLIKLCGTSDALEALVAAHSEDDLWLNVFCWRESRNKVLTRIKQLPPQAAVAELFFQDELGDTAFVVDEPPVEVLESMIILGKLDAEKGNILDIADIHRGLPKHHAAHWHPDPAAIKLLARHPPQDLLIEDGHGNIPLDHVEDANKSSANMSLLRKLTTAYKHGNFSAPIRLCGTSDTLQALAVRSTDDVPLRGLCDCGSWETVCARIEKIPTQVAIEEMHEKDEERRTAFATAVVADAPVELLESMVELG